jgi:MFS family permease
MFLLMPAGISFGFAMVTFPFVLKEHGFAVATIGYITALGASANLYRFLWAPVVDTTLSLKKWYILGVLISAISLITFLFIPLDQKHISMLVVVTFISQVAATFIMSPVSAFMAKYVPVKEKGRAAGWFQSGNLGGMGLGGGAGIWIASQYNFTLAVIALAVAGLASLLLLWQLPQSPAARESSFAKQFNAIGLDLKELLRSPVTLFVICLIFSPIGSGAASNLWSSVASDWKVGPETVALMTGTLSGLTGILGCVIGGWITDKWNRWIGYFGGGVLAAVITLLMMTDFSPLSYNAGVLAYSFAIGIVNAGFSALLLFALGSKGLVSTKYSLMSSIGNLPVVYMTAIDGWLHDTYNIKMMLLGESVIGIIFVILYVIILKIFRIDKAHAAGENS